MGLWLVWLGAALAADARVTPVEKVLTMIKDLSAKVDFEGLKEAKTYDEYACFCKSSTDAKLKAIDEGEKQVATLTADIGASQSERETQTSDVETLESDIETLEVEIQNATEDRKAAREHYEKTDAEMDGAIKGVHNAIKTIRAAAKGANHMENGVPVSDYGHGEESSDNVATLEALMNTFRTKRTDLQTEEASAKSGHELAMQAKHDLIKEKQTSIKAKNDMIDTLSAELAALQAKATRANAELNDDRLYLKELSANCKAKKIEYDQRSTLRAGELAALHQATNVLDTTVKEYANKTGEGRDEVLSRALAQKPRGASLAEVRSVSLLQLLPKRAALLTKRAVQRAPHWAPARPDATREAVAALLTKTASRLGSRDLEALATRVSQPDAFDEEFVAGDLGGRAFDKVKGLVTDLIARLQAEAKRDATHQGWCVEEMAKAEKDRDYRLRELDREEANQRKLQARKAGLADEIAVLTDEIAELESEHDTAETARDTESGENAQTVADAQAGAAACKEAITILENFYGNASTAEVNTTELLQRPTEESRPGPGSDTGADMQGAYKGDQSGAGSVIGMLDVILSDFNRMDSETTASEAKALREWTALSREMQDSISSKKSAQAAAESETDTKEDEISTSMGNIRDGQKFMDTAVKSLDQLYASCKAGGQGDGSSAEGSTLSAGDRTEKREAEIAALKDALCILGECMPGVAEPVSQVFLQRAH